MIKDEKKLLTAGEDRTAPCFCIPCAIHLCFRNTVVAERSELKKFSKIYKKTFHLQPWKKRKRSFACLLTYVFLNKLTNEMECKSINIMCISYYFDAFTGHDLQWIEYNNNCLYTQMNSLLA